MSQRYSLPQFPKTTETAKAWEKIERKLERQRKNLHGTLKAGGMDVRAEVLSEALALEFMMKTLIGPLIGTKSEVGVDFLPISLDSCRRLLYQLGILDQKKHEGKLKLFDEIRNQFVHNLRVESYADCFDVLKAEKEKYILKLYPQNVRWKREQRLKLAVKALAKDCRSIVGELTDAYFNKTVSDAMAEQVAKQHEYKAMTESVVHLFNRFRLEMKGLVESGYNFDESDIDSFPMHLYKYWAKDFKRELYSLVKTGNTKEEAYSKKQKASNTILDSKGKGL